MPVSEVEEILSRSNGGGGTTTGIPLLLPGAANGQEDMETLVFAMLYEDEPKSLF